MRIAPFKRRTAGSPLEGVSMLKRERTLANDIARTLVNGKVPFTALSLMRTALAHESLRLEAAGEWTGPDSEAEAQRRERHERTLITYLAVDMACHRIDK